MEHEVCAAFLLLREPPKKLLHELPDLVSVHLLSDLGYERVRSLDDRELSSHREEFQVVQVLIHCFEVSSASVLFYFSDSLPRCGCHQHVSALAQTVLSDLWNGLGGLFFLRFHPWRSELTAHFFFNLLERYFAPLFHQINHGFQCPRCVLLGLERFEFSLHPFARALLASPRSGLVHQVIHRRGPLLLEVVMPVFAFLDLVLQVLHPQEECFQLQSVASLQALNEADLLFFFIILLLLLPVLDLLSALLSLLGAFLILNRIEDLADEEVQLAPLL